MPLALQFSCLVLFIHDFGRHHTNPVGTEWKWKMDDAETIINGVMTNHYEMIKQFRGSSSH